ncbi:MAG: FAD:protein FMN transferase, partial [Gammaproteobacteria bacterium]|nr:FAD:protein FMN transferase [Gammaproteobacteria bacterium]
MTMRPLPRLESGPKSCAIFRLKHYFHTPNLLGRIALIAAILAAGVLLSTCSGDLSGRRTFSLSGATMGTTYTIKIISSSDIPENLNPDIINLLSLVDRNMSTYRQDSEVSRFNRSGSTEWTEITKDTLEVVEQALHVSRLSAGGFDITVAPLINLWGFGPGHQGRRIPTDEQIREQLASVGYTHLHTRDSPPAIRKDIPELRIDLSAIAKGYAVDRIAEHLESAAIRDYMVEIGGELRVKGHNARNKPWTIAVEKPVPDRRSVHSLIQLTDQGLATSGDYRNYFEQDGQRFSHTIDPRTGRSSRHKLASVTVITPSAMHADAMATALTTLGP